MMDCLTIGDEIALRLSDLTGCLPWAEVRRTAFDQAAMMHDVTADRVLISLGNHPSHYREPNLFADLRYVRSRITARQVLWILPLNPEARDAIRRIASLHQDVIVETPNAF